MGDNSSKSKKIVEIEGLPEYPEPTKQTRVDNDETIATGSDHAAPIPQIPRPKEKTRVQKTIIDPTVRVDPTVRIDPTVRMDKTLTESLLRATKNLKLARSTYHEEPEEPADERWLVSYADMMTLLFGLFVMLYSLAVSYKDGFEVEVKQMSEKSFGGALGGVNVGGTDVVPDEIEGLRTKLEATSAELNEFKGKAAGDADIISNLQSALEQYKAKNAQLAKDMKAAAEGSSLAEYVARVQKAEGQLDQLKEDKYNLEEKLKKAQSALDSKVGKGSSSFLALIIHWPTMSHDIDLIVEDPKGKKFDFKKRSYKEYPGSFTLDTRRGPGAEIWQTDRVIPGVYKVTYSFYSTYGNESPATVEGNISSVKGKVALPTVTLDIHTHRQQKFSFEVDTEGNVTVL